MIQFHETKMGQIFFNKQLPELTKALNRLSDSINASINEEDEEFYEDDFTPGDNIEERSKALTVEEAKAKYGVGVLHDCSFVVVGREDSSVSLPTKLLTYNEAYVVMNDNYLEAIDKFFYEEDARHVEDIKKDCCSITHDTASVRGKDAILELKIFYLG